MKLHRRTLLKSISAVALPIGVAAAAEDIPQSLYVEGYTNQVSYAPGEDVILHVSTTAPNYTVEVSRLGATNKVVLTKSEIPGASHRVPEHASTHGCGWPESFRFPIPKDWPSGYYH